MGMKLAEALGLRKQLAQKVDQLKPIMLQGKGGLFETKVTRKKVSDEIDEVTLSEPKIRLKDITAEYDKYATALRKIDSAIQKANWLHEIDEVELPEGVK